MIPGVLLLLAAMYGATALLGGQGRLPRNRWWGIRTKYIMRSDESWKAAHRAAAPWLWGVAAIAAATAAATAAAGATDADGVAIGICVTTVVLSVVVLVVATNAAELPSGDSESARGNGRDSHGRGPREKRPE